MEMTYLQVSPNLLYIQKKFNSICMWWVLTATVSEVTAVNACLIMKF